MTDNHQISEHLQHRAFAMSHACHQDSLLQQYRLQLLGFEVAIAIVALGLGVALMATPAVQIIALALLLYQHRKTGDTFRNAILSRQRDVDWAQKELMFAETKLAAEFRTFTRFKVYQDHDDAALSSKFALFLADEHTATAQDIADYFFCHKSQSRGKAAMLLALPATGLRMMVVAFVVAPWAANWLGTPPLMALFGS